MPLQHYARDPEATEGLRCSGRRASGHGEGQLIPRVPKCALKNRVISAHYTGGQLGPLLITSEDVVAWGRGSTRSSLISGSGLSFLYSRFS